MAACWWRIVDERWQTGSQNPALEGQDRKLPVATAPAGLCKPQCAKIASRSKLRCRPALPPAACAAEKAGLQNFQSHLQARKSIAGWKAASSAPAPPALR